MEMGTQLPLFPGHSDTRAFVLLCEPNINYFVDVTSAPKSRGCRVYHRASDRGEGDGTTLEFLVTPTLPPPTRYVHGYLFASSCCYNVYMRYIIISCIMRRRQVNPLRRHDGVSEFNCFWEYTFFFLFFFLLTFRPLPGIMVLYKWTWRAPLERWSVWDSNNIILKSSRHDVPLSRVDQ